MAGVNELDKELIKAEKMDIHTVHVIINEMDARGMPAPDLSKRHGAILTRAENKVTVRQVRLIVSGVAAAAVLLLFSVNQLGIGVFGIAAFFNLCLIIPGGAALFLLSPALLDSAKEVQ